MNIHESYNNGKAWLKKKFEEHTSDYKLREEQNIADILSTKTYSHRKISDPREFKKGMLVQRIAHAELETNIRYAIDSSLAIVSDNYPDGGFIDMYYLSTVKEPVNDVHTNKFPEDICNTMCMYEQIPHTFLQTWHEGIDHCLMHPNENLNGGGTTLPEPNPLIKPFSKKEIGAVKRLVYGK
jgi:hypothetical protein